LKSNAEGGKMRAMNIKGRDGMKILVAVKRVIDPYVKVRVKSDESGVDLNNVKMSMNPFDEIAVEQALRIKEKGQAEEVILVSIGDKSCQETIRTGLALGADRGIHIDCDSPLPSISVAKLLKRVAQQEKPGLIILGKQSIDGDNNQTGQMLSQLLDWPQATFASEVIIEDSTVLVTREIDGGLETQRSQLPAVITTDLRLNEPRYASLPNIMKAKRKPLDELTLESLEITLKNHLKVVSVSPPCKRQGGQMVSSVDELVDKLKNEAKVI
jgi:electron transfer flavoprotein beta subunit